MNQDYLIRFTPAIARKMTELACIAPANIDQRIRDLAKTGLISDEQFDALPIKIDDKMKKVVQQLVDENFRSMMVISKFNDEDALVAILCAARIADIKPITILLNKNKSVMFRKAFKTFGLSFDADIRKNPDVLLITFDKSLSKDHMFSQERRGGLLIAYMIPYSTQLAQTLSIEFEKMVVVYGADNKFPKEEWYASVEFEPFMTLLFPHSNLTPLKNNLTFRKSWLLKRGFHQNHPRDFRFMFNINDDYDAIKTEDTKNNFDEDEDIDDVEFDKMIRARIEDDFNKMF